MQGGFVLAFVLAMLVPAVAAACSPSGDAPIPTDRDLYAAAKLVVLAHMTKVEERLPRDLDNGSAGLLMATVRPFEILKGEAPAEFRIQSEIFFPGNCTLPLLAGADYLLFLDGTDTYVFWPDGSTVFMNLESDEAREQIEAVRAMKTP